MVPFWASPLWAAENPFNHSEYHTPLAGEAFKTFLFGKIIEIPKRDRSFYRALNLGFVLSTPKVVTPNPFPFFAFFYKQYWPDRNSQFRAILVGVFNQIDFEGAGKSSKGLQLLLSFQNLTPPAATSEIFDGREKEFSEVYQGYLRGGIGVGGRFPFPGGGIDNEIKAGLLYEPGFSYFENSSDAASNRLLPPETYEHRLHLKIRIDGFTRNLVELRHRGWNFGLDGILGRRENWRDHGLGGEEKASQNREYFFLTAYGSAAFPMPFLSEKHRILPSFFVGYSPSRLDRYSAMPLGGGPTGDETESLGLPILYGTMFSEYLTRGYGLATLEYRYEALFFLYFHFRLSGGWMKYRDLQGGRVRMRETPLGAASIALTTGFAFNSLLGLEYSYNWEAKRDGSRGRHVFLLSWSIDL